MKNMFLVFSVLLVLSACATVKPVEKTEGLKPTEWVHIFGENNQISASYNPGTEEIRTYDDPKKILKGLIRNILASEAQKQKSTAKSEEMPAKKK